ncbi:hypothetical protein AAD018_012840 [Aestuariibius insulae]|uniref:hypothetical protein n=1 Tax=Aestuariibius insulae TaxID=2058287 RepID=UPI00345E9EE6
MYRSLGQIKHIVTAGALLISTAAVAETGKLDALYDQLQDATEDTYLSIEEQIYTEWGRSGSASMDLLVKRGREAIEVGDTEAALDHFSALVDHAPDFAEGYAGRAQAYFELGLFGPALDDLRQTLVLEPRHFGAMAGLAIMFEAMEEPARALEAYEAAAAVHPLEPSIAGAIERLERRLDGQTI